MRLSMIVVLVLANFLLPQTSQAEFKFGGACRGRLKMTSRGSPDVRQIKPIAEGAECIVRITLKNGPLPFSSVREARGHRVKLEWIYPNVPAANGCIPDYRRAATARLDSRANVRLRFKWRNEPCALVTVARNSDNAIIEGIRGESCVVSNPACL